MTLWAVRRSVPSISISTLLMKHEKKISAIFCAIFCSRYRLRPYHGQRGQRFLGAYAQKKTWPRLFRRASVPSTFSGISRHKYQRERAKHGLRARAIKFSVVELPLCRIPCHCPDWISEIKTRIHLSNAEISCNFRMTISTRELEKCGGSSDHNPRMSSSFELTLVSGWSLTVLCGVLHARFDAVTEKLGVR